MTEFWKELIEAGLLRSHPMTVRAKIVLALMCAHCQIPVKSLETYM
jgi:hypothetical protein